MKSDFEKELETLINKYSKENDSDTPDFIQARYLNKCLDNFSVAIKERELWYSREKHVEDLPLAQSNINIELIQPFCKLENNQGIEIGENTTPDNQKNIFIGHSTGYDNKGNFIGSPVGQQSNFSPELQEDIFRLEELGNKLLGKIKKARKKKHDDDWMEYIIYGG